MNTLYKWLLILPIFLFSSELRIIRMENRDSIGMFATCNQILGQIYLFESGMLPKVSGIEVNFKTNGSYYDPNLGPNWWTYYFDQLDIGSKIHSKISYPTTDQYWEAWKIRYNIPREIAARIIKKHIHVKPAILHKVNTFKKSFFKDLYIIGIHYRGNDKKTEAPRVNYKKVFKLVEKNIPKDKEFCIFVATDEQQFLDSINKAYPGLVISTDSQRSSNGKAVHHLFHNSYETGEQALIDCLLLSRCSLLIRTSSNLSLWSTFFNPELPVVLLNNRYSVVKDKNAIFAPE